MINRKRLSFSLPDHNETTVQSDEWLEQALANATEAIGEYQSSRSLSAEDIQMITAGIDRFLTTDKVGKTARSFNMPAIAGKVAFVYCDVQNPDTYAEKVKAYIRNDRERFYVGRGRSADHSGGVVLLQRVSEKERVALLAKREEQDRKAAEEEQEETTA